MSSIEQKGVLEKMLYIQRRAITWNNLDFAVFFLFIPLTLIIIFLLPQAIKNQLILNPLNPTFLSIFFSNYTHSDLWHFLSNFLFYIVIMYYLVNLETNRRIFYKSALIILMIPPILISLIVIYLLNWFPPVQGFSGVVSGFTGYLVYSVYQYVKKFYIRQIDYSFAAWILIVNIWLVSFLFVSGSYVPLVTVSLFSVTSLLLLYFSYIQRTTIQQIIRIVRTRPKKSRSIGKTLFFSLLLTLLFSLPMLMPVNIVIGVNLINTPAHYLGYVIGITSPFLIKTTSMNGQT